MAVELLGELGDGVGGLLREKIHNTNVQSRSRVFELKIVINREERSHILYYLFALSKAYHVEIFILLTTLKCDMFVHQIVNVI